MPSFKPFYRKGRIMVYPTDKQIEEMINYNQNRYGKKRGEQLLVLNRK